MKILVECPVCENRFHIANEQAGEKKTGCSLCGNTFEIKSNQVKEPKQAQQQAPQTVRPRESSPQQAKLNSGESKNQTAPPIATRNQNSHGFPSADSPVVAKSTKARAILKRRKSPLVPILLGMMALGSCVALILVVQYTDPLRKKQADDEIALTDEPDEKEEDPKKDDEATSKDSNSKTNPTGSSVFRTEGESDEVEKPPTNAPPDKPPKNPNYRYYSSKQAQDFWAQQFWHFVRLRVQTAEGSHYVSGTIVDSRGWVVTSLSAVANATEIEVQSADSNLREFNGVRLESTDLVRGVIKTAPDSDLVLLAINRSLVVSPSSVNFGTTEKLVGAQHFVQCACPGSENLAWPTEVKLDGRKTYEQLGFDFKSQIDEKKLDTTQTFIVHNGFTDTALGSALFSLEGDLIAINTTINDRSKKVVAIPVEEVVKLISSSSDDVMSLSTLTK